MKRKIFVTALVFLAALSLASADQGIESAQQKLKDEGFYYGEINGVYGPAMEFSLRAYHSHFGLALTGHLDVETLAALDLLPRQRTPAFGPPRRRISVPRWRIGPGGERVYIPD